VCNKYASGLNIQEDSLYAVIHVQSKMQKGIRIRRRIRTRHVVVFTEISTNVDFTGRAISEAGIQILQIT
jgi:hypothetical protein